MNVICGVLNELAYNKDGQSDAAAMCLVEGGAVSAVCNAMDTHCDDERVLGNCCLVLKHLYLSAQSTGNPRNLAGTWCAREPAMTIVKEFMELGHVLEPLLCAATLRFPAQDAIATVAMAIIPVLEKSKGLGETDSDSSVVD